MTPLEVTATIRGAIALPNGPIHLDALLAYAVCAREGKTAPVYEDDLEPIDIPVELEPGGRFHLATVSHYVLEEAEHRWVNRRFPIAEAQAMGNAKLRVVNVQGGACKSYRLPLATMHLKHDQLRWWCVGDAAEVEALLTEFISYLGKRRATGLGKVVCWEVKPCEPWGDDFPIVRDGQPMRPLPVDWPGLAPEVEHRFAVQTFPYWRRTAEELLAVPAFA